MEPLTQWKPGGSQCREYRHHQRKSLATERRCPASNLPTPGQQQWQRPLCERAFRHSQHAAAGHPGKPHRPDGPAGNLQPRIEDCPAAAVESWAISHRERAQPGFRPKRKPRDQSAGEPDSCPLKCPQYSGNFSGTSDPNTPIDRTPGTGPAEQPRAAPQRNKRAPPLQATGPLGAGNSACREDFATDIAHNRALDTTCPFRANPQ